MIYECLWKIYWFDIERDIYDVLEIGENGDNKLRK